MFEIASKIIICLLLAALLGFIIGYLLGKMRKCDDKNVTDEDTVKYHPKAQSFYEYDTAKKDTVDETQKSTAQTDLDSTIQAQPDSENSIGIKPQTLKKEDVTPDDLKRIKGVGVKIESALNELGIYTFAQIASWGREEVQWVDEHLVFKGRIDREEWIEQAKILADGEETEFSKNYKNS